MHIHTCEEHCVCHSQFHPARPAWWDQMRILIEDGSLYYIDIHDDILMSKIEQIESCNSKLYTCEYPSYFVECIPHGNNVVSHQYRSP